MGSCDDRDGCDITLSYPFLDVASAGDCIASDIEGSLQMWTCPGEVPTDEDHGRKGESSQRSEMCRTCVSTCVDPHKLTTLKSKGVWRKFHNSWWAHIAK